MEVELLIVIWTLYFVSWSVCTVNRSLSSAEFLEEDGKEGKKDGWMDEWIDRCMDR